MFISLNTQEDTTIMEEQKKSKQKKSNQVKKSTSYSLLEKSNQKLSSQWKSKLQYQLDNVLVLNHHNQSLNSNSINCWRDMER